MKTLIIKFEQGEDGIHHGIRSDFTDLETIGIIESISFHLKNDYNDYAIHRALVKSRKVEDFDKFFNHKNDDQPIQKTQD